VACHREGGSKRQLFEKCDAAVILTAFWGKTFASTFMVEVKMDAADSFKMLVITYENTHSPKYNSKWL
jgi:hypothetical protein